MICLSYLVPYLVPRAGFHLAQLMGELIVYSSQIPMLRRPSSVLPQFQTSPKSLGQLKPNFVCSLYGGVDRGGGNSIPASRPLYPQFPPLTPTSRPSLPASLPLSKKSRPIANLSPKIAPEGCNFIFVSKYKHALALIPVYGPGNVPIQYAAIFKAIKMTFVSVENIYFSYFC